MSVLVRIIIRDYLLGKKAFYIFVKYIIHKTRIDVDVKGTRAGTATAVAMADSVSSEEPEKIYLNPPFFA